jgi:hypothetical protein
MTETWTEQEVAALPQIEAVFDQPALEFDTHEWQQQGYHLIDVCNPSSPVCHPGGIQIPYGKLLVKKGGKYELVNELSE